MDAGCVRALFALDVCASQWGVVAMRRPTAHPGHHGKTVIVERLIGTVRRECLDRMLIFGEAHLANTNLVRLLL
jgi:hypothetical protein